MERSFLWCRNKCLCVIFVFIAIFSTVLLASDDCAETILEENEIEKVEESFDYESLGKFEDTFRQFEIDSELEDNLEDAQTKGFLKKWSKKLKKWFAKKVYKIFKKMTGIKKLRNGEDCAYTIAKFKRKIDKKLYHTGDIEEMLSEFDQHTDGTSHDMNKFKDRIRFYYKHKKVKPPGHGDEQNQFKDEENQLKNIPTKALIGGLEIACGSIIAILPFPGCRYLGVAIISYGITDVYEAYKDPFIEEQERLKKSM